MKMQELDSLLSRSEKLCPMPEIVYPAEKGEKLNPIILASGTSEKDAIRIAKDLGRVLGHNRAQIILNNGFKIENIEV